MLEPSLQPKSHSLVSMKECPSPQLLLKSYQGCVLCCTKERSSTQQFIFVSLKTKTKTKKTVCHNLNQDIERIRRGSSLLSQSTTKDDSVFSPLAGGPPHSLYDQLVLKECMQRNGGKREGGSPLTHPNARILQGLLINKSSTQRCRAEALRHLPEDITGNVGGSWMKTFA